MDKSEPTLVPQWLRSSGTVTGGGTRIHPLASSLSRSDDCAVSKLARKNSSVNGNDQILGRSSVPDRATSSYFRRGPNTNGSAHLRASSSFSRNQRERNWDKDIYESREKDKSTLGGHRHRDHSDPLGNILSSRVEMEGLRRSQSMISERQGESWSRKVEADSSNAYQNNNNDGRHKAAFERDFPSLGAEEKWAASEIGRLPSPGLSAAIHNLPVAASAMIGSDKWTSALAEVPAVVGCNGTSISSGKAAVAPSSASVSSSSPSGLNMAAAVAQGPPRVQTTPQLSTEAQRLEELAIKQSRQLIPVTPSMPKALVLNPPDKLKIKVGQQQPISSSNLANHSPRGGSLKPDLSRTSSVGKLYVLKPAQERNGVSPAAKDSLSPSNGSKVPNSPLAAAPLDAGSATVRSPAYNSGLRTSERKPVLPMMEKKPISQAQSRNDFFNLMRKKSVANPSSVLEPAPAASPSALNKPSEIEVAISPVTHQSGDDLLSDSLNGVETPENAGDITSNGNSCSGQGCLNNGKNNSGHDSNFFSEEEEAALLHSLGWEENADEDGLTEDEINAFYRDVTKYIKSKPSSKILQGMQPRFLLALNSQIGSIAGISSGLNSSSS